jgi:hypothetical protein
MTQKTQNNGGNKMKMTNLIAEVKLEINELQSLGVVVFNGALQDSRIKNFFANFVGGSRELSDMIDCYLQIRPAN